MNKELLQQALDALEFPHDSEWSNKAKAIEALQHALTQPDKKEQRMTDEQIADWSYKMQIACNKSTSDSDINIIKLIQHIENLYEQGRADEREACAKIADDLERKQYDAIGDPRHPEFKSLIGNAIRARGKE